VVPSSVERVHEQHDATGPVEYGEVAVKRQTDDLEPGRPRVATRCP
jgi:hypothetical protein